MVDIAASHRSKLGCSEIAISLGMSPWKTALELWLEKTGRAEFPDLNGNLRVDLGHRLEQVVADLYMARFGCKVIRDSREFTSFELPLVGHIDRRIIGRRAGLEIKTSLGRFNNVDEWGEEGTDQIPIPYLMQVMGYLMLTGYESWDVAVLLSGPEFRVYTVRPDQDAFNAIQTGVLAFWRYVETDLPPPVTTLADAFRRWPLSMENQAIALVEQVNAIRELRDLQAHIKGLEAEADQRELAIKLFLKNAEVLVDGDGRKLCSWKTQTSQRLDISALKSEMPDVAKQYLKETQSRVFRLAKEK